MSSSEQSGTGEPQAGPPQAGPIALVGGGEWQEGCDFDAELAAAAGASEVLVLPTAAAYEHPERVAGVAEQWLAKLGLRVRALMVLTRGQASEPAAVATARSARFVYLVGESPMHLRSVLKDSPLWDTLVATWREGAAIAGSSAGAMVLTDPMVDPRGGAFTVGLGLLREMAVIPHYGHESAEKMHRSLALAGPDFPVVGIPESSALVRDPDGRWRSAGRDTPVVFVGGRPAGLEALPARRS